MKRLLNIVGSSLGVLALIVLAVALALTFAALRRGARPVSWVFQSPLGTPTQPPYPASATPTPQPTPRPRSTRPPEPPTRTPTPTFTPAPPTPTPAPLPPLVPGLQTFVYATTGERFPEIYRVQVDLASRTVKSNHLVHTADLWRSRTQLLRLFPSPDGERVAIAWAYGDAGYYVSILDVHDGRVVPLLGEGAKTQQAIFLDWSPDGNNILVLGFNTNADLRDSAWLVDVRTREYREVDIKQVSDPQRVFSASFSSDGKALVYAQTDGYKRGSEVWRIALDGSERQLLFKDPEARVEDVLWSSDGNYIAFTQWRESTDFYDFALGELWLVKADGSERRLLSPAVTGYHKGFVPVWSPNGQQIAFIQGAGSGRDLNKLSSNGYVVDVQSGEIRQLTTFQSAQVLNPIWSTDGTHVVFAARQDTSSERFEPWVAVADSRNFSRLDQGAALVMDSRISNPIIVWLPVAASGGGGQ